MFPTQTTPVDFLTLEFLIKVDMVIRQNVQEIAGLPADTSLHVYYTERTLKGFGILQVK